MKKLIFALFAIVAFSITAQTVPAADGETVNYRVMYKWGLINKQAGRVAITTKSTTDGRFNALLAARTEKWADPIYKVRDTLRGTIDCATYEPLFYEKISHEGGEYKHDVLNYSRKNGITTATCKRTKQKNAKKPATTTEISLDAEGLTLDMLSAFYYMRSLNYDSMTAGQETILTVFSGKRKETLTITYAGRQVIEVDDVKHDTYKITFTFTGEQGKKTSDDMEAWISTDSSRIPLKLEGKLAVGKVQCFYYK